MLILLILLATVSLTVLITSGALKRPTPSLMSVNQLDEQQHEALAALDKASETDVTYYSRNGILRYVSMRVKPTDGAEGDAVTAAQAFLREHANLFQIEDVQNQFTPTEIYRTPSSSLVHFQQSWQDIMVFASDLIVEVADTGEILAFHGGYVPRLNVNIQAEITSQEAFTLVSEQRELSNASLTSSASLVIFDPTLANSTASSTAQLAWLMTITSNEGVFEYVVGAQNGHLLSVIPMMINLHISAEIYDVQGDSRDAVMDKNYSYPVPNNQAPDAGALVHSLEITNGFFNSFPVLNQIGLGRYDQTIKIITNISLKDEYCDKNQNGAWMKLIDGVMILCPNSSEGLDVFAHEYTHYLTQKIGPHFSAGAESAALNESWSDIFAALVANYGNQNGEEYNDPWKISFKNNGEYIIRNIRNLYIGNYIRFMFSFGADGNVGHYRDFARPGDVKCEVGSTEGNIECAHLNSTIHTRAAFKITNALGFDKAEKIFYHTLINGFLTHNSNFFDARLSTHRACMNLAARNLFDISVKDCNAVFDAYDAVGINDPTASVKFQPEISLEEMIDDNGNRTEAESYLAYLNSDGNIWVMNASGEIKGIVSFQITDDAYETGQNSENSSRLAYYDLQWSPDGRYLSFVQHRFSLKAGQSGQASSKLFVFDMETTTTRELIEGDFSGYTWKDNNAILFGKPINWDWSSQNMFADPIDGIWKIDIHTQAEEEFIAPVNRRPLCFPGINSKGNILKLHEITNCDGSDNLMLYDLREKKLYQLENISRGDGIGSADISPSDDLVAFDNITYMIFPGSSIYLSDFSGNNQQLIIKADDNSWFGNPKFSPDGSKIAFVGGEYNQELIDSDFTYHPKEQVYIYDLQRGDYTLLIDDDVRSFQWSPYENSIIFTVHGAGGTPTTTSAKEINVETGEVHDFFSYYYPVFQPLN